MAESIYEQTGWKRPFPEMICQDHDVLMKINCFDYNLDDPGFVAYFRSRTGIVMTSCECGWDIVRMIYNPDGISAEEKERILSFRLHPEAPAIDLCLADIKITKSRLQDCWELWKRVVENETA